MSVSKYGKKELDYLTRVVNSDGFNFCSKLEKNFAKSVDAKYAVAMNSGTATLHAALESVGVTAGDEVITPALTVIMDTTAILHANAIPVYADINPHTFNIDVKDVEKKITNKTKAIIAVSIYGLPCDTEELSLLAQKHNIALIEDNAQCFGVYYKSKPLGSFSDVASWSFENSKHMSCGEGGIITTNSSDIAKKIRKISSHGYISLGPEYGGVKLNKSVFQDPDYKRHDAVGWNYRLNEFSAAVALAQLETLKDKVELRRQIASMFLEEIQQCDYLLPQASLDDRGHSYFTLAVLFDGENRLNISWKSFRQRFVDFGGDGFYAAWSVPYLEPLITENIYKKRCSSIYNTLKYRRGLCPVAESLQPKMIQLKTNYRDLEEAAQQADALRKTIQYYGGN